LTKASPVLLKGTPKIEVTSVIDHSTIIISRGDAVVLRTDAPCQQKKAKSCEEMLAIRTADSE
jgi:hypothetical protein